MGCAERRIIFCAVKRPLFLAAVFGFATVRRSHGISPRMQRRIKAARINLHNELEKVENGAKVKHNLVLFCTLMKLSLGALFLVTAMAASATLSGYTTTIFDDEFDSLSLSTNGTDAEGNATTWNMVQYTAAEGSAWRKYQSVDDGLVTDNGDGTVSLWAKKGTYSNEANSTATSVVKTENTYGCGGIFTDKTFTFQYGYVEVKAKFDNCVQGTWPAIWLMPISNNGHSWPYNGEIDIMEHLNAQAKVFQTLHFNTDSGSGDFNTGVNSGTGAAISGTNDWHTYGMEWQPDSITYYIDGSMTGRLYAADYVSWPFARDNNKFYLMIDEQVGGSWVESAATSMNGTGGIDGDTLADTGASMTVDYARVYSADGAVTGDMWKNGSGQGWNAGITMADGSTWANGEQMCFSQTKGIVYVGSIKTVAISTRNGADISLIGGTIANADLQVMRLYADKNTKLSISSAVTEAAGLNIGGADSASISISGAISGSGAINVNSGKVTFAGSVGSGRALNINAGSATVTGVTEQTISTTGTTVSVCSGAELSIASGAALFRRDSTQNSGNTQGTVTVSGTLNVANFGWGDNSSLGHLAYTASNVVLTNGARINITETGASGRGLTMNGAGATYTIGVAEGKSFTWNADTEANVLTQGSGAGSKLKLDIAEGATMTMSKAISDGLAIDKVGAGRLAYQGDISLVSGRNLFVGAGSMSISGSLSNTSAIVAAGSLAVSGSTILGTSNSITVKQGASFTTGIEGGNMTVASDSGNAVISATAADTVLSPANSATSFSNAVLTIDTSTDYELAAQTTGSTVKNTGSGALTLSSTTQADSLINDSGAGAVASLTDKYAASEQQRYTAVKAVTGNITLLNKQCGVAVSELRIAGNSTVRVYTGAEQTEAEEAAMVVSKALTAEAGCTLNANLTVSSGATVSIADGGLHLGSTLTLNSGTTLENYATIQSSLSVGQSYTLFTGVDALTLAGNVYTAISADNRIYANTIFDNVSSDYVFTYSTAGATDGGTLSLCMVTPEPVTATLSLLAFIGFCSRRRRH